MTAKKVPGPRESAREVDAQGNCSKCGGTHYGSLMCPIAPEVPGGIPAEAGERLADALAPLAGHAPEHDIPEAAAARYAAGTAEVARPKARWRDPIVSTADFSDARATMPYVFGLTSVAAGLRKLADAVEAGEVLPQGVTITQSGRVDDFHLVKLCFEYADRQGSPG
jgi:hypothetical protein